jgi:hypothetical protein
VKILPLWWLIGLLFACHAATAQAEGAPRRSVSYSTWLLEENLVTARLVLPAAEAASLVGKTMPLLSTENLSKYVLSKVSVTAGGSPCEPADQGYDIGKIDSLSLGSNLYGFEIFFRCSRGGAISLHNALLFAEAPQHVDFARVERGGVYATQLFTATRQDVSIPEGGPLPAAGGGKFLMLGATHLWHSLERLCAILGFFILARTRRQLSTVLAALAFGYAASLLLVVGGFTPDAAVLDSGVGCVIACVAAVMVARSLLLERAAGTPRAVTTGACIVISGVLIASIAVALLHRPSLALVLSGFAIVGATLVGATLVGATLVGATLVGVTLTGTTSVGARPADVAASLPIVILPALAGLLDGLVLPGDFARLRQWGALASSNLAAFDAGALLIEALLLAAFAAVAAFMIGRALKQRIRPELLAPLAGDVAATMFAGCGSFWLLSRLN